MSMAWLVSANNVIRIQPSLPVSEDGEEKNMPNVFAYGLYILIWPAITLAVLILICTATYRDIKKAKRNNEDIV
jgi:hypothetical protein